jgi:glucokinase
MLYLGVDLGGTNIKAALADENGQVLCSASRPTLLPRPAEAVCEDIVLALSDVLQKSGHIYSEIAGLGVGCPGTVDGASGMVVYSNNLNWSNFAMRRFLQKRTGLPVHLGNDANVAALGEAIAGCGKGAQSLVVLTLGTGVGSGVVLGGRLLTGYTGAASELGHMVIEEGGEPCSCGRRGCLESYASATAMIRMTKQAMAADAKSLLHTFAEKEGGVSGRTAFDAAAAGDRPAKAVVAQYIHYLAVGVANTINIFFPEVIGLSGGIAKQGETLLAPLRAEVEGMVFGSGYAARHTRIVSCTLGYQAGVIGAALLAAQSE